MERDSHPDGGSVFAGLATAAELVPAGLVMVDRKGIIVLVNREVERLFGYTRDEIVGKPIEVLIPSRFARAHVTLREDFARSPQARSMGEGRDLFALRKDGTEFPVEIGLNPISLPEGHFVLGAIIDVTERKKSEAKFRMTVESAPLAMIMVDSRGNIVLANSEALRLFGYTRDDLIGQAIEILVPSRSRDAHPRLRGGYHGHPEARRMGAGRDLTAVRRDGSEFPVEIGLNPIDTEDGTYVLSAVVDITERKRLEEQLRELNENLETRVRMRTAELARSNEALEKSNMNLRRFAYVASHDLRAPLRSISGFAQLIQHKYGTGLDSEGTDWIRRVVENAQTMHTLIEDLLTYSRVDSSARAFEAIDLNGVLRDALSMISASIDEVQGTVTSDELPTVRGDRSQLVQLLQNLIENGLKYRNETPPVIHVGCSEDVDGWLLSVRDNGIGIDPRHHEKIFEIFSRLHTTRTHSGTGIGLAICRRVVNEHGGRIWVDSSPGQGATFFFSLPKGAAKDQSWT